VKFETEDTKKNKEECLKRRFIHEDEEDKEEESEEFNQNEQEENNEESSDEEESEDLLSKDGEKDKKEDIVTKESNKTDIRKSGRNKRTPAKFNDYVYLTYSEAINGTDKEKWKKAIEEEKCSLKENNVWEVIDENQVKLDKQKPLHSKWIFCVKQNGIYKARLVVKGCEQKNEIDYQETYSPVIGQNALRSIFAIAAAKECEIVTFDVKTAFLYGELEDEVYMYPPEGYNYKRKILKLKKALYGLKQAPLRWNIRFTNFLKKKGFIPIQSEQCIFRRSDSNIILSIYVDDGLLISSDIHLMDMFLKQLNEEFKIKINRDSKSYVGLELNKSKNTLHLNQKAYIKKLLQQSGMEFSKPVKVPIIKGEQAKTILKRKNFPYREIVGSLLYASTKTRPDIAYGVNYASRYMENPMEENVNDVKHILKYLKGNVEEGIGFKRKGNIKVLEAFSDADFAGDVETRRSTSGYIIFFAGGPISWCSRKQPIIAQSTTEAEYVAAAECCKELIYLKSLLEELLNDKIEIHLNMDNQSAIMLIKNGVVNRRSKHIDVKFRYIYELVKEKTVVLKYCPTTEMLADIFTKPLNTSKFTNLKDRIMNKLE